MKQKLHAMKDRISATIQQFSDIRFVGQIVFVVIVLLVSWSGIKSIQTNYSLQKQIGSLKQQNNLQQLENENQQLQNDYYNSAQYLELSARQNFGLAAPGEKEVVVPASVAETYVANLPNTPTITADVVKPPVHQQNVQAWMDFFLHHASN
jgi:cell division protein FtsB